MELFETAKIGRMELKNRLVMPPMCMYVCANDGKATEFHKTHYAARALGDVGLIIVEATGVSPAGRISDACLGLWSDDHIPGMKEIVDRVHSFGSKIAVQISHAGRKSETTGLEHLAPSAIDFNPEEYELAREMTKADINRVISDFTAAAVRADKAGYDALEIHAAHGYLIHQFLSPLSNERQDEYGGNTENRARLLNEILASVRAVWPEEKPLWIRISATDHVTGGLDVNESVRIIDLVKRNIDAVHVSTGGLISVPLKIYHGYQIEEAEIIRLSTGLPVIGVGLIDSFELVQNLLEEERVDFVALGRALLRNPFWLHQVAAGRGKIENVPASYHRGW